MEFDERFKLYPSFGDYVAKMREGIQQQQLDADDQQHAINQYLAKHPPSRMDAPRIDIHGKWIQYPKWQGSQAQKMLCIDLEYLLQHDLLEMTNPNYVKPEKLWNSHEIYKEFPLKVFREHIYQTLRTVKQIKWNNHLKKEKLSKLK